MVVVLQSKRQVGSHFPVNLRMRHAVTQTATFCKTFLGEGTIMSNHPSRPKRLQILFACAVAIIALPLLFEALPTPEIHFVLPTDFHGGFIIVEDNVGIDLGGLFGRLHTITVPESRIARVRSFALFNRWHTESIQFGEDGTSVEVNLSSTDDAIELRSRGFSAREAHGIRYRERMSYFYGTSDEADKFDPYSIAATPEELPARNDAVQ